MKKILEITVKSILTTAMILLCVIVLFSSCTTQKNTIAHQRIIVDSLGIHEVLPPHKAVKK